MKTKFGVIAAAIIAASMLTVSVSAEEHSASAFSKYPGFSYEAAGYKNESLTEETEYLAKITESTEVEVTLAGDESELTGIEKLYQGLLEAKDTITFDSDDFVYTFNAAGEADCTEFINVFFTLIESKSELSHVDYSCPVSVTRLTDNMYYVSELSPVYDYGKSGEEKLHEGLANGNTLITFDKNDFAYHYPNDGDYFDAFTSFFREIAKANPDYRIKRYQPGGKTLSGTAIYSVSYVEVEYYEPEPEFEDDGVPGTDKILAGLYECKETIELDQNDFVYSVPTDATEEQVKSIIKANFSPIFFNLVDAHPEIFYLNANKEFDYGYSYVPGDDTCYVTRISPKYTMSKSQVEAGRKVIEEKVELIVEYLEEYADTDFEKALLLHDYICLNFEYDTDLIIHDIYTFIKEGNGVCEAYAKLYRYVLERVGLNVKYASSEQMQHLWNIVELDDKWYNVDVTWADPTIEGSTTDKSGYVRHDYFLISDADFQDTEIYPNGGHHYNYVTDDNIICDSDYNGAFWTARAKAEGSKAYAAPIVFDDENFYYITNSFNYTTLENNSAIISRSRTTGETKCILELDDMWKTTTYVYPGFHSGLALVNDVLIYNTPTEIRYIHPNGKNDSLIAKIAYDDDEYDKHRDKTGSIYRFGISLDGKFYEHDDFYTILDNKSEEEENNNGKNNYFGMTDKYNKYDKHGRNKEYIEVDYFIMNTPDDIERDERDVKVEICSDTIHHFEVLEQHKATYLTKGWKKKKCSVCENIVIEETEAPMITEGDNAHEPNAKDVTSVIEAFVGKDIFDDNQDMNFDESFDFDGDSSFDMHDLYELFRMLREQINS